MKPQEKAIELVSKYRNPFNRKGCMPPSESLFTSTAKQCALIAVDEIVKSKSLYYLFTQYQISCMEGTSDDRWIDETFMKYWKEVKQHIKKL